MLQKTEYIFLKDVSLFALILKKCSTKSFYFEFKNDRSSFLFNAFIISLSLAKFNLKNNLGALTRCSLLLYGNDFIFHISIIEILNFRLIFLIIFLIYQKKKIHLILPLGRLIFLFFFVKHQFLVHKLSFLLCPVEVLFLN